MSPSYREPSKREDASRSVWSTTSIFIALGFLTLLMGMVIYGAIQGYGSGSPVERPEIRATR